MKTRHQRSGAVIVELAVCLPTILLLVFGSIECCGTIFLQQSLTACSYEGARQAIKFNSKKSDVLTACDGMLKSRRIKGGAISMVPDDVSSIPRGSKITVQVSAPCSANSFLPYWFFSGRTLVAKCTMVKE